MLQLQGSAQDYLSHFAKYFAMLLLSVSATIVNADQISGVITVSDQNTYFFKARGWQKSYPVRTMTQEAALSLVRLSNNDYIQGHGQVTENEVMLDSIDFVGLQNLLGVWRTSNNIIFHFKDYQTLIINKKNSSDTLTGKQKLNYSIAPNDDSSWSFFMSEQNKVVLGLLTLEDKQAEIKFFNTETGEVQKSVHLKRRFGNRIQNQR